mmetsp:Transcript_15638/g.46939  ORF Transcript_15638/g.46939 Transcript_15638/m.46939 type:complete len:215 (-) Transcript_15638:640-1284(-)
MRNWKDRSWSGPSSLPASQPKRSRRRATLSARRSRKSGKLRSRTACPVGAVSMMMRSNFSFLTSSRTSTRATISSLPGGSVSKRFTKSSMGNCSSTWPTMPPPDLRLLRASFTVSWKRRTAAFVSTSMPQSSPAPEKSLSCLASAPSFWPRASPSECAGSVEMMSTRCPSLARRTARAELIEVLPTPPLPPKSITSPFDSSVSIPGSLNAMLPR